MIENNQQACEVLVPWMKKTEVEILDQFSQLSRDRIRIVPSKEKYKDYASLYIPGTREDRVLLVAHIDTVFGDHKPDVVYNEEHSILHAPIKFGVNEDFYARDFSGIGADDRAGVAILWELRNTGHSLFLTSGEERGSIGSKYFIKEARYKDAIDSHRFAVQFDRHGYNDLVFYNCGSKSFREYCENETNFVTTKGTFTDICILCDNICGVNISVGYRHEHGPCEFLHIPSWRRTLATAETWLSKPNLPEFRHFRPLVKIKKKNKK